MTQRDKVVGPSSKDRVDLLLVERGLAPSRAKAQALVLAGQVFSGELRIDKPGQTLSRSAALRVQSGPRYVSRGGDKLEGALIDLALSVQGLVCVDVGASTGGFTDCLLQHGAARVYAVDVGEGQLAARLQADERVVVKDRTNARHLQPQDFPEPLALAVVDASFIGIDLLAPALARVLPEGERLLALIKPQFEAGRREATRARGVIRDPVLRGELIDRARETLLAHGFRDIVGCDCRVRGPKGNLEHFLFGRRGPGARAQHAEEASQSDSLSNEPRADSAAAGDLTT